MAQTISERHAIFPTVSPKTVRDVWKAEFVRQTHDILDRIAGQADIDVVNDFAMPVSAEALKSVTGLTNMDWREMDRVSQGMIDGCANYTDDPAVESHCHECTASIDRHIVARMGQADRDDFRPYCRSSIRRALMPQRFPPMLSLRFQGDKMNPVMRLRCHWSLLAMPDQLDKIRSGQATWMNAFEEYARWMSPIGMSPRRIAQPHTYAGFTFQPEERVFFMFSSANRDEDHFENSDQFDVTRDVGPAISFGAGPHFLRRRLDIQGDDCRGGLTSVF